MKLAINHTACDVFLCKTEKKKHSACHQQISEFLH